jgi:hypothetical protein
LEGLDVNQIHRDLVDLNSKLQRMVDVIEVVKDRQEMMADDIAKIKNAVYNPDEGIYARLRELEGWKQTTSKIMWIFATSLIGLVTAVLLSDVLRG